MKDDITDLVLEDIKQQNVETALRKYGKLFVLSAIAFLILGTLFHWWTSYQRDIVQQEASEYFKAGQFLATAKNQQSFEKALALFEKSAQGKTIYATLAKLHLATLYESKKNSAQASQIYQKIADSDDVDPSIKSFAALMKFASDIKSGKKFTLDELNKINHDKNQSFKFTKYILQSSLLIAENQKEMAKAIIYNAKTSAPDKQQLVLSELLLSLTTK